MIFEDLQWIDSEGREAMDYIVERLPPSTLLLGTYRPEHADGWSRRPGYSRIRLEALPHARVAPLRPEGAHPLLGGLVGAGEEPGEIRRGGGERARGNPLFLEESVR